MATAKIIFQQNGDGYSIPASRDDLVLGLPVTMLNQNNTGATSWSWVMVDRPTGSSAAIVSPTASTTTFTPDIVGTYLIHLSVNAGAATDQRGAAVKTANFHYRIPAATETIEFDGYRGWATATNAALKSIDDGYIAPSALPIFQSIYNTSNPASFFINTTNGGFQIHDASTPTGLNIFEVDAYGAGSKYFTVAAASTNVNNNLLVTGSNFIGVNTNTPLYPVHVSTGSDGFSFVQTRSGVSGGTFAQTTGLAGLGFGSISNHPVFWFTNNGGPQMTLSTTGALGIGVTSPTSQLHVVGTGHFTGAVALDAGFTSGAASSMGGFKITSLATPTVSTDAANKSYVDAALVATSATLQTAYAATTPANILLNSSNGAITIQDSSTHLGSGLNGGHTPLFKVDAYNSASNYMTIYRAGEELNRETGSTSYQMTGAAIGVTYDAIWGSSTSDIYAVGYDASVSKQQIAHYNGSSWTTLTSYPGAVADTVNTVYGFSSSLVYIGTQANGGGPGGIWFTGNSGTSWTQQYSTKGINTIWGPDSTHIYAGVQDNSGLVLFSNGGGSWSPVTGNIGTRFINQIWGVSSTEFWVATSDSIWHTTTSGSSFTSQFDTNSNSTGFFSIGVSVNWKSIWGTSASNIYAVGTSGGAGYIAHYNGTFWTLQVQSYPDPLSVGFTSIYGTTGSDVYVTGGQVLLYSNGNGAWIPQQLTTNILSGGVSLNAVWAPSYNQWYVAPSNTNPVGILALASQGGNFTAPGIGTFGVLVTNKISTPDVGTNSGNAMVFTAFMDANQQSQDSGFIFNTTQPIYTTPASNSLAIFQSGGVDVFRIKGDGYLYLPSTAGFKDLSGGDIFNWTPSNVTIAEPLQVNTMTSTGLATFQNHILVDGYTIDISAGATTGQGLIYNGTSFVPASTGITVAQQSNVFDLQITTTSPTLTTTFTPLSDGNFVVYIYYRVTVAPTDVTIEIDWTDNTGAQTLNILPTTTKPIGSYSVAAVYIQVASSNPISVTFTAGTANQLYVSSTIISV